MPPSDSMDFLPFQMSATAARSFQRIIKATELQVPKWRIIRGQPPHQLCSTNGLRCLTSMDAARVSRTQRRLEDLDMTSVVHDAVGRRRLAVPLSNHGV